MPNPETAAAAIVQPVPAESPLPVPLAPAAPAAPAASAAMTAPPVPPPAVPAVPPVRDWEAPERGPVQARLEAIRPQIAATKQVLAEFVPAFKSEVTGLAGDDDGLPFKSILRLMAGVGAVLLAVMMLVFVL
ncbi:hypothetical protein KY386_03425 [Candidatus Parcubacteria bacterium]|nr:hypothetical protein [Candidatus Parcubacteria bacterium]